ncbi:hypothetical protein Aau02nite_72800 [Amorphoplanes auranticolor]|uniref:DDE superfamily endonuclease n=1 Tax=Actinoplanes auranticolor TaxID=47988 RepID=A0A919VVM3_9ACTN|nr:hypothetical protein Aau02nite_72800 [Actinoplanes auranticolor]
MANGDPFTRLAAGFGVGTATAWCYAITLLTAAAAAADDLTAAMTRIRRLAYAILDGTLIPIDRVADQSRTTPENTNGTFWPCITSRTQFTAVEKVLTVDKVVRGPVARTQTRWKVNRPVVRK